MLVFKALHTPQYLADDCQLVTAVGRYQLRSSDALTCVIQNIHTRLGERSFAVAGPRLCNSLPHRPGFPAPNRSGTGFLTEDCQLVAEVSVRRLRSADTATCSVTRRTSNTFGDRFFSAAGPRLWNSLPINLRQCRSLEQFKRLLKTFLFSALGHGAL